MTVDNSASEIGALDNMNLNGTPKKSIEPYKLFDSKQVDQIAKRSILPSALVEKSKALLLREPFPTSRDELWRQSAPSLFPFERLTQALPLGCNLHDFSPDVMKVGKTPNEKFAVPKGVSFQSGEDALSACGERLEKLVVGAKDFTNQAVSGLQLISAATFYHLKVEKNVRLQQPLVLSWGELSRDGKSAVAPVLFLEVGPGAEVVFLEQFRSTSAGFVFPRVELLAEAGSSVTFISVQDLALKGQYLARHAIHCKRDSQVDMFHVALGCEVSRIDLDCYMEEPGASARMRSVYLADDHRHVDFHPTQYHLAPHCFSDLYCKGALKDEARSVYYGYIRVAEEAQKTDAYQTNRTMLLSAKARADSIPNLEIKANDVKCSHGSSMGQVSEEDLFYIVSRGLSREEAERLLVEGFISDLLASIKHEELKLFITEMVLDRLHLGDK